eukprot:50919-Pyramimonas_sp.AAC.1
MRVWDTKSHIRSRTDGYTPVLGPGWARPGSSVTTLRSLPYVLIDAKRRPVEAQSTLIDTTSALNHRRADANGR